MSGKVDNLPARRWIWLVWSADGPPHVVQRAILQVLFDFIMTSGKAFPSERTIAEKVGTSERTIRGHVQALEAGGWLQRTFSGTDRGQGWRRTQYTLSWPKGHHPDTDPWLQQAEENRQQARAEFRESVDWQQDEDEPEEPGVEMAGYDPVPPFPDLMDLRAWAMYVDHRKRLNRPMSKQAEQQAASKLLRLNPEDQIACVEETIRRGQVNLRHREWPSRSGEW
jgi:DNA-binding transcriptional MocR family regulator